MRDNRGYLTDISKAASKAGNVKTLGDVVGLPDKEDKEMIRKFLVQYEKKHPGEIQFHRDAARARLEEAGKSTEFAVIDKTSNRRYVFELPTGIGQWLERSYPLMFRDKQHFAWFCNNFPELRIGDRY